MTAYNSAGIQQQHADAERARLGLDQQRLDQQRDSADQRDALGYYKVDQGFENSKELKNLQAAAAEGRLTLRGQQQLELLTRKQQFQGDENQANRDLRGDLGTMRNDTTMRGQDLAHGDRVDSREATDARQRAKFEHDDAVNEAREASRTVMADARVDARTRTTVLRGVIRELEQRRRNVFSDRQKYGDEGWRNQNYAELTNEIQSQTQKLALASLPPPPQAAPQPMPQAAPQQQAQPATAGFDAQSYGMPGPDQEAMDALQQVAQQVAQEMPTASREAKRMEVKNRLMQLGLDPRTLGVR